MSLMPQKLLMDGEQVKVEARPAFWTGTKVIGMVIAILLCWTLIIPLLVVAWVLSDRYMWDHLPGWGNWTVYALTNRRVLRYDHTWLRSSLTQCTHDKVQNVDFTNGLTPVGHRGRISFDTAGTTFKELVWSDLKNAEDIHSQVSTVLHS